MHIPVMLNQAVDALVVDSEGTYLDATFGRGGHAKMILSRLSDQGKVIAVDRDPDAIASGQELMQTDRRLQLVHSNFSSLKEVLNGMGIVSLNGALFDLGVSTNQIQDAERGFSFQKQGPLDMRMDTTQGQTLSQWLESASETDIAYVLKHYGEERYAKSIANAIIRSRPILDTVELASIILKARPYETKKHAATKSFQAFRVWINRELESLRKALDSVIELLVDGARLVVISFHSLEDRLVKQFINSKTGIRPDVSVPTMDWIVPPILSYVGKTKPDTTELQTNISARSAIMRVAEKVTLFQA